MSIIDLRRTQVTDVLEHRLHLLVASTQRRRLHLHLRLLVGTNLSQYSFVIKIQAKKLTSPCDTRAHFVLFSLFLPKDVDCTKIHSSSVILVS